MDAALIELWQANRGEALARASAIEDAAAALAAGSLGPEERELARAAAHKLRGSVGMYGFAGAGELAGEAEDLLAGPGDIDPAATPRLAQIALSVRSELEAEPRPLTREDEKVARVLLVSDAPRWAVLPPGSAGISVAAPDAAAERVMRDRPDVVIVDPVLAGSRAAGLGLIAELAATAPEVPVLALSGGEPLEQTVEAMRRGARAVVEGGPGDPGALAAAALAIAARLRPAPATVLAVDDDPAMLAALEAMLAPHGFRVETVDGPDGFWERLEEVDPDLALVDLDMPGINGIELTRAIRADRRWSGLPLLMLTAYREPELVARCYAAGIDDYLAKPIIEEELVGRIRNRLDRQRVQADAARRDPLTGASSRRAAVRALEGLAGEPGAVAILDVDGLTAYNARAGLDAGDALLRELCDLLRAAVPDATIGRWDGDEFLVVAPATATALADPLRRATSALSEGAPTVSGGLVTAGAGEVTAILSAARDALAEAKRAGGGRIAEGADSPDERDRRDVVVVEDDPSVVDVLELALGNAGLSSTRCGDGEEAVRALTGGGLEARVVLLDWDLPGLDGLSVLRALGAAGVLERSRVIMLTARGGEGEMLKALELGAADYVAKPFSVPVLVERLRKVLAA